MTARPDAQLVALFAEKVLGLRRRPGDPTYAPIPVGEFRQWSDGALYIAGRGMFNPLSYLDDAFAGLRAHAEDWDWKVSGGRDDLCFASVWDEHGREFKATDPDLCRALVLASLKASGVPDVA